MSSSKFHLVCSCVICKREYTTQSLKAHVAKHTKLPTSNCLQCNLPIFKSWQTFCNNSCAAKYNNSKKDYTKFKPGPKKFSVEKLEMFQQHRENKIKLDNKWLCVPCYSKIKQCVICNKFFHQKARIAKSCSKQCKSKLCSISQKISIANGHGGNKNRGRGKQSYLEKSFEQWIKNNYPTLEYETEKRFKRLDMIKTYFGDFYFPSKKLLIELDGSQHNIEKQKLYDTDRDQYITSVYEVQVIRISYKEYVDGNRIAEIARLLY